LTGSTPRAPPRRPLDAWPPQKAETTPAGVAEWRAGKTEVHGTLGQLKAASRMEAERALLRERMDGGDGDTWRPGTAGRGSIDRK